MHQFPNKIYSSIFLRLILTLVTGFTVTAGCSPPDTTLPFKPFSPSAISLLEITPFIGDETTIRDPAPETARFRPGSESLEGWFIPPVGILRFPLTLNENARLSLQLYIANYETGNFGDIQFKIEFVPDANSESLAQNPNSSHVIFEDNLENFYVIDPGWLDLDFPLDNLPATQGELCFIAESLFGELPGIDIFLGTPAIYYPEDRNHRNVLLIGIDTLRADAVSVYGGRNEVTPSLEKFSQAATIFTQARAQSSWTLPSFASMITGGLPSEISATICTGHLPDSATTLGEILRPQGYATKTICTNVWLGNDESGFQQGMDEFWYVFNAPAAQPVEKAMEFITNSIERDWFCYLQLLDPHAPYSPPEVFRERTCDPGYGGRFRELFNERESLIAGDFVPTDAELEQIHNLYLGEVAYVDEALGAFFDFLESNGLLDETLIIFSADHGEEFNDHGGFDHGHTMFDEMVRTPLIVRGPGFQSNERVDTSVGNMDIFPTILEYIQIPIPHGLAGLPLQDLIASDTGNNRFIFGEGMNRGPDKKFAVQWPYKCILNFVTGESCLYNLENDPLETEDISASEPEITRELGQAITARMLPDSTAFHLWFVRDKNGIESRFTGTIELTSDIERIQNFGMEESDIFEYSGGTLTFDISNSLPLSGIDKHLAIFPTSRDVTLEASLRVNGDIVPEYFYPYGTMTPEPSGHAVVDIRDYPLGPDFPMGDITMPAGLYIWGVRGFDAIELEETLDPESLEQLRSLGYI